MDFILTIGKWLKSEPSYIVLALVIGWMFKMLRDKDNYIHTMVSTLNKNTENLIKLTALIEVLVYRGSQNVKKRE